MIAVTTCWLVALLGLAVTTANPVTVNRSQLLAADAVVLAEADRGSVRANTIAIEVDEVLWGRHLPRTVRIVSEETDRFESGVRYLVPLHATQDGYAVAPVPKLRLQAGARGLVLTPAEDDGDKRTAVFYPATDDVLQAAERILTTQTARPYP